MQVCGSLKIQDANNRHLRSIAQICRAISSELRHISTIGKKLLSNRIFSRCSLNMVNFSLLAAEIGPVVWGTPAIFQQVSRLGSVTARYSSSGHQTNFAALNRRRHQYSAGRPSWASAHIVVMVALWNRADHYISAQWFLLSILFFFPRLISAVADWMSAILPHMV